ncbi:hypothetical protein VNO77_00257 [Canavalia gladiata]|uniref:Uncharacterized protein n=1 Tax=Canavalia gladiata TaxID=3824 RepID=A0AAN9MP34_CANGL
MSPFACVLNLRVLLLLNKFMYRMYFWDLFCYKKRTTPQYFINYILVQIRKDQNLVFTSEAVGVNICPESIFQYINMLIIVTGKASVGEHYYDYGQYLQHLRIRKYRKSKVYLNINSDKTIMLNSDKTNTEIQCTLKFNTKSTIQLPSRPNPSVDDPEILQGASPNFGPPNLTDAEPNLNSSSKVSACLSPQMQRYDGPSPNRRQEQGR